MKIEPKSNCPLNNFNPCKELECAWFIQVRGTNPNNGKEVDEWACSMAWMPILMIENSQQQRQTGSAVESFRNEMVKANETNAAVLLETTQFKRLS
jgi:hypothetical protein